MRAAVALSLIALAAVTSVISPAAAQQRRRVIVQDQTVPFLRVRPRSLLEPGNVVAPGSIAPSIVIPSIGLGAINRVPCDTWESVTPVPFVGSTGDLVRLCPGFLR